MSVLRPCESCGRHVKAGGTTCPFCARAITPRTLAAAAIATALVSAAGCTPAPVYVAPPAALYGGPPSSYEIPDAAAASVPDSLDASTPVAPTSAGDAASTPPASSVHPVLQISPMYGAPPPRTTP
jgi:hypothetical protein